MWDKNQKKVRRGMKILKLRSKWATPSQVKNIIPIVFVIKPTVAKLTPCRLPCLDVIKIPIPKWITFKIRGAITPKIKYNIVWYLILVDSLLTPKEYIIFIKSQLVWVSRNLMK